MGTSAKQLTQQCVGIGLMLAATWLSPFAQSNALAKPSQSNPLGQNPTEVGELALAQTKQASLSGLDIELETRTLQEGNEGEDVESLQRALDRNGLYFDAFDGVYGPVTSSAVSEFQQRYGLPVTGRADAVTLEALGFNLPRDGSASRPDPDRPSLGQLSSDQLMVGMTGDDVTALQQGLNRYGYNVAVDGIYGNGTAQGVRSYQQANGLDVTGVADRRTLQSMGFRVQNNRYVASIIADENDLSNVRRYFPNAVMDEVRQGDFINIGNFSNRREAERRTRDARERGFDARVIYRRR
jgi:peptidoglycan hydrolase-like protein with peptidoglycan-binding domain